MPIIWSTAVLIKNTNKIMTLDSITVKKDKKVKKKKEKKEKKEKKDKKSKKSKRKLEEAEKTVDVPSKKLKKNVQSSEVDVEAWRKENEVKISSEDGKEYPPITTFEQAKTVFSKDILKITENFEKPSPIQAQSWPVLLDGRDIVSVAETGSGKTIGFLLPGILKIQHCSVKKFATPRILICAPTRELAMQNAKVADEVGSYCGLSSYCVYGGTRKWEQKKDLQKVIHIMVATPGRLLDQIADGVISLSDVSYMILDEADRMLDLGFEKDIRRIFSYLPEVRQTLLFTATWPESIQNIAKEFIQNPVHVTIGSTELTANVRVKQIVEVINDRERDARVLQLLRDYHSTRKNLVLLFVLYKKEASRVEMMLQRKGYSCCSIHGNLTQDQRIRNFDSFKSGKTPLLIATDVAARGLDIPNVSHVINYSFPLTIEDYIHRIGRTGRAGKSGVAHTFFQDCDKPRAGELQNVLREAGYEVPKALLKYGSTVKRKSHGLFGDFSRARGGVITKKATKVTFDSDSE